MKCNAYLNLCNKERQDYHVRVSDHLIGQIHAVFVDAFSDNPLDSENGVCIELEIKNVKKWMADYRHSEYWCRPEFGTTLDQVPDETQGFIYEKEDGDFGVILPAVSEKYKCVLCGGKNGLEARLFSWYGKLNSCHALAFLYGEGESPFELLETCTKAGLELLQNGCRMRKERRYPEMFEYLGWCSWDAFEIKVDEESLIKKCREFQEKKLPVKWAIIDDMWAEVRDFYGATYQNRPEMFRLMHSSKLYSFCADPYRFPNGLKSCIEKINTYGIKVGMWHPTTGYWMGIDPDGEIFRDYRDLLIQSEDGRFVPDYQQANAYQFYSAFHHYLRQCGAEFIKIDNQSMTRRFYRNLAPVGEVARQYHNAIEASVGQHFDNQMINCMGMASEDMWNRSVSCISRCSDDFLPEDKEWFTKHVLQCTYNCMIQGQFYVCDWDMWWTDDGQAKKNSVIRAVSGGPIYIGDTLGRTRSEVLWPLMLRNGKILRCDRPGMPTRDCITVNPVNSGKIFKIQNICNESGVIAAFNLDGKDGIVTGTISPKDVEGIRGEQFVIYEHFSRDFKLLNREESIAITLSSRDEYKLFVIVPIINDYAMIGRTDKYISPKTVQYNCKGEAELVEDGPYAYVKDGKLYFENTFYQGGTK